MNRMEFLNTVYELGRFLWRVWTWLISPSVRPVVGALAAVAAAMLVVPGDWIRRPIKVLVRALLIGVVWLVIVFLAAQLWPAQGSGGGGSGGGSTGGSATKGPVTKPTAGRGTEVGSSSKGGSHQPESIPGDLPPLKTGAPSSESTTIRIRFFPSRESPQKAADLACHVYDEKLSRPSKIHVKTRDAFRRELRRVLAVLSKTAGSTAQVVEIDRFPFPGEGTIREIKAEVRRAFPENRVEFLIGESTKQPSEPE